MTTASVSRLVVTRSMRRLAPTVTVNSRRVARGHWARVCSLGMSMRVMRVSPLSRAALAVTCHITVRAKPWPGKPLSVAWGPNQGQHTGAPPRMDLPGCELGVIGQPDHRLGLVLGAEGGEVGALQAQIGGAQGVVDLGEGRPPGPSMNFSWSAMPKRLLRSARVMPGLLSGLWILRKSAHGSPPPNLPRTRGRRPLPRGSRGAPDSRG
jgi:hypothetical protein